MPRVSRFLVVLLMMVSGNPMVLAASSYGDPITAVATAGSQTTDNRASAVVNDSGMSGTGGKAQLHDNLLASGDMWLTTLNPGERNWIQLDLGAIHPLGELLIWNYNASDPAHPKIPYWKRGLKDVHIYTSVDNKHWVEFKGAGYPFKLAPATGSNALAATNLDNPTHSPINFGGLSARYVKIVPSARPGVGNWGGLTGHEARFGLSQFRVYSYSPQVVNHGLISAAAMAGSSDSHQSDPINLTNNFGMSGPAATTDTHDNQSDGADMWLSVSKPGAKNWVEFNLGGTYPLGSMYVWNYNRRDPAHPNVPYWNRGLKDVKIYYSLDGRDWTELKTDGYPYQFASATGSAKLNATNLNDGNHSPVNFGGVEARYVKIIPDSTPGAGNWGGIDGREPLFGLSAVRFYATTGMAVAPTTDWTSLFSQYNGWTGSDGVFSVPLNGVNQPGSSNSTAKTLLLFGDTFVGTVDPVTKIRLTNPLVNNTLGVLTGNTPDPTHMQFIWNKDRYGSPQAVFTPTGHPGDWYWLQDGVVVNQHLYVLPILMAKDPTGPPGFQFKVMGVNLISVPVVDGNIKLKQQRQLPTKLFYHPKDNSGDIYFGAGIMANTAESGSPYADGYIYVYGYKNRPSGDKQLVVARVLPSEIEDADAWRFWDGNGWSSAIAQAAPLVDHVSSELSVTPLSQGGFGGKFVLVFEKDSLGKLIEYSTSNTPEGPFQAPVPLYATSEQGAGESIYTYNAKAHPNLSQTGELLISYNVNSSDWNALTSNADIYRPRWLRVWQIK